MGWNKATSFERKRKYSSNIEGQCKGTLSEGILYIWFNCVLNNILFRLQVNKLKKRNLLCLLSLFIRTIAVTRVSWYNYIFELRQVIFWCRYVDDILVCFNDRSPELNNVLNSLNNIHPKVKFSLELPKEFFGYHLKVRKSWKWEFPLIFSENPPW